MKLIYMILLLSLVIQFTLAQISFHQARTFLLNNPCARSHFSTYIPSLLHHFHHLNNQSQQILQFKLSADPVLQIWQECELYLRVPTNITYEATDEFEKNVYQLILSDCYFKAAALILLYQQPPSTFEREQNLQGVRTFLGRMGMVKCREEMKGLM